MAEARLWLNCTQAGTGLFSGKQNCPIYFLDAGRHIAARDEFQAENDETAITIACLLYDACSDRSSGFELWRGARRLVPERDEGPAKPSL